jgi:hypothetical protein
MSDVDGESSSSYVEGLKDSCRLGHSEGVKVYVHPVCQRRLIDKVPHIREGHDGLAQIYLGIARVRPKVKILKTEKKLHLGSRNVDDRTLVLVV